MNNKYKGSTFDSFLEEEGILDEVDAAAVKKVIAYEAKKNTKKSTVQTAFQTDQKKEITN